MKSRQVGYVLMALILMGIAGLIIRVVSPGSDELVLSGLLPITQDVVDKVVVRSKENEAELVRIGDTWRVGNYPAFVPKLDQFWATVADIPGAQLVATNPANHERIGVRKGQGTVVSFYLGPSIQEQFIVGRWNPDVRLCYLRRSGKDEVYGIPCPRPDTFAADPDAWRNPVVAIIPREQVESVTFTYPGEEFAIRTNEEGDWVVASDGEEQLADLRQVDMILATLEALAAQGFADEEESADLNFNMPVASVRIVTKQGATAPTTRLRFLDRDAISYYLNTPAQSTIFIVDKRLADGLLRHKEDLVVEE